MDADLVCFASFIAGALLVVTPIATLTKDNTPLELKKIEKMISKCEGNEGLDYIEHDYDVTCKNGAYFTAPRGIIGEKEDE